MTTSRRVVPITKMEAAERQLVEAVRMFFGERDEVSVHTLAGASVTILGDLAKHLKIPNALLDGPKFRPGGKDKFIKAIKAPQNFFKHADKDPNGSFDFRPASTPFRILEGVFLHRSLTHRQFVPELFVFQTWFMAAYPELFAPEVQEAAEAMRPDPEDKPGWATMAQSLRAKFDRGDPMPWQ